MKLSKSQIDYAIRRLNDKIEEKKNLELPPVTSNAESESAVYDFLNSFSIPLVSKEEFMCNCYTGTFSRTINYPASFDSAYTEYKAKSKEFDKKYDALKLEIQDKLHLCGDASEALALINSI